MMIVVPGEEAGARPMADASVSGGDAAGTADADRCTGLAPHRCQDPPSNSTCRAPNSAPNSKAHSR